MSDRTGLSRGDRNRNAWLARLRCSCREPRPGASHRPWQDEPEMKGRGQAHTARTGRSRAYLPSRIASRGCSPALPACLRGEPLINELRSPGTVILSSDHPHAGSDADTTDAQMALTQICNPDELPDRLG